VYGSVGPENDEQIDWYLERLGLSAYRDTEFSELSSGFQTRVALAAALLKQPRLLIIDEPLANLDTNAQSQVLGQIRDLSGSRKSPFAALISSQHVHLVEAIADRVLFLENGRPRYYGRASDIRANRKRETFELACDLSAAEVQRLLPADCSVIPTGVSLIVHAPRGTAPGLLISTLVARQVTVKYFRSIGDSSRMYFLEADDGRGE
jgi:ABC-2 type transport system ATP-binding protein